MSGCVTELAAWRESVGPKNHSCCGCVEPGGFPAVGAGLVQDAELYSQGLSPELWAPNLSFPSLHLPHRAAELCLCPGIWSCPVLPLSCLPFKAWCLAITFSINPRPSTAVA